MLILGLKNGYKKQRICGPRHASSDARSLHVGRTINQLSDRY